MRVLFIDSVHPILKERLEKSGMDCVSGETLSKQEVLAQISDFQGIVIRSKFIVDREFLKKASSLRFIARSGSGLENIDLETARKKGITIFNSPEGNRNAVAEHAIGMLMSLFNNLNNADREVRNGLWQREALLLREHRPRPIVVARRDHGLDEGLREHRRRVRVERGGDGDDGSERGHRIARARRGDRRRRRAAERGPTGVVVLDEDRGGPVELRLQIHGETERGVEVEQVVIGQLLALKGRGGGEALGRRLGVDVPPGRLVRVLAVAQGLSPRQRRAERRRDRRVGLEALGQGAGDQPVVARGVGVDLRGEVRAELLVYLAVRLQRLEDPRVVGGVDEDDDVAVVLRRRSQEARPADVDVFDQLVPSRLAVEGALKVVEVHDHDVDRLDAVLVHLRSMGLELSSGQDAAEDLGVERLHPPVEHLGRAGEVRQVAHVDARRANGAGRPARGQELGAELREPACQLVDAGLVGDAQQRALHWVGHAARLTSDRRSVTDDREPRRRKRELAPVQERLEVAVGRAQLLEARDLDLPNALASEVHDVPDLLQRHPAPLGDVERAGLLEIPHLLVGEVDLDRTGVRVDVEVEVIATGDVQAGALGLAALAPIQRALVVHDLRQLPLREQAPPLAEHLLARDGLAPAPGPRLGVGRAGGGRLGLGLGPVLGLVVVALGVFVLGLRLGFGLLGDAGEGLARRQRRVGVPGIGLELAPLDGGGALRRRAGTLRRILRALALVLAHSAPPRRRAPLVRWRRPSLRCSSSVHFSRPRIHAFDSRRSPVISARSRVRSERSRSRPLRSTSAASSASSTATRTRESFARTA
jgi:hypothetical protein